MRGRPTLPLAGRVRLSAALAWLGVLSFGAASLGLVLAAPAGAAAAARGPASAARAGTAGVAVPELPPDRLPAELARLRSDGINTISLFVWWLTARRDSVTLAPYPGTQSDASLLAEMREAVRGGFAVTLTPLFYCQGCEGGWRGTVRPADVPAFFSSYRAFIDHYADLAARGGASTLYVGSEMTSLEDRTGQWERVVAEARRHFGGRLAYEENWDVLGRARFLGAVDLVGVSAYFPLDDQPAPPLARLRSDWTASRSSSYPGRDWVAALGRLARDSGRPIVFGEVGYMSGDFAARQPFLNFQGQADWQLQSDLYQALLETFSARPWWAGVVWWDWYRAPAGAGDNTRTPRDKTAEALLRAWYHDGRRPADPDRPLVGAGSGDPARPAPALRAASVNGDPVVAAAGAAGRGLGPAQEAGLAACVVLLLALGGAVWLTLGRTAGSSA